MVRVTAIIALACFQRLFGIVQSGAGVPHSNPPLADKSQAGAPDKEQILRRSQANAPYRKVN